MKTPRLRPMVGVGLVIVMALSGCTQPVVVPSVVDEYRNYYEIFVGSFADSDGDGVGDLAGITSKLDYIRHDLGADGLWLTPINPSPSYHKYDVTDYEAIDVQFGTMEDFRTLIKKAHDKGIRVLVDLVVQHTSWEHPWFTSAVAALQDNQPSPYIDYYYFSSEPKAGYTRYLDTNLYYDAAFTAEMPDLNLSDPGVRTELATIVGFWLGEGVDGFRLDATTEFSPTDSAAALDFMEWLMMTCRDINPDAYLVGEAWTGADTIASYYSSGVSSFFNYPFATVNGVINQAISAQDGVGLAQAIEKWNQKIHSSHPMAMDAPFISNHDNPRPAGYLMRDLTREKLSAATYLLMPGSPFIYYGEEIGMVGSGSDPNVRMPMVWSTTNPDGVPSPPPGADYDMSSVTGVDVQLKDPNSLLNFYHDVLAVKAKYPVIARGEYSALATNAAILGFRSSDSEHSIYVFENLSDSTLTQSLSNLGITSSVTLAESLLPAGDDRTPSLTGGQLSLPPYSIALITECSEIGLPPYFCTSTTED